MRPPALLSLLPLLLGAAPAPHEPFGGYGRWSAVRAGDRCYAIAARGAGSVAVSSRPAAGLRAQLQVVPSRAPAGDLVVEVGARRFALHGDGRWWARDARADLRIVAAMRVAELLVVRGRDRRGRRFADRYPLAGAPSAIDATILGCLDNRAG